MATAPGVQIKGGGLISGFAWMEAQLGPEGLERVIERMPAEYHASVRRLSPNTWYDLGYSNAAQTAFVAVAALPDRWRIEKAMVEQGAYIADDNIKRYFKFLLSGLSPRMLLTQNPAIWKSYFKGIDVSVEMTGETSGTVTVRDLKSAYVSLLGLGWMRYVMEMAGAEDLRITERSWSAAGKVASSELVYDVSWK